jgi:hypothetical protein
VTTIDWGSAFGTTDAAATATQEFRFLTGGNRGNGGVVVSLFPLFPSVQDQECERGDERSTRSGAPSDQKLAPPGMRSTAPIESGGSRPALACWDLQQWR